MDKWNRLTDLRGTGAERWEDWKRLAQEHIRMWAKPMDTDNIAKVRGGGKWGISVIVSIIKKEKGINAYIRKE